jgi:DNA-binding MarR family transcriptional regulator
MTAGKKTQATPRALPDLPCACATVRRAARLVTQLYGHHLRSNKLEASQFTLLSVLNRRPGNSQVVLGKVLGFDKTTLSRNLKLLQKKGWVESAAVEGRRERGLYLTAAGRKLVRAATPGWNRAQEQLRSAMSSAEWKTMWEAMRALTRAAREVQCRQTRNAAILPAAATTGAGPIPRGR